MTAVAVKPETKAGMLTSMSLCGLTLGALLMSDWPRWVVMWSIAACIFALCKWLSWLPVRADQVATSRRVGYFLAWPGLDGAAFVGRTASSPAPRSVELAFAIGKSVFGLVLIFVACRLISEQAYPAGWIGMAGIAFSLHFGLFHILSWIWRRRGAAAQPIMDWPVLSTSVSEFWGRRWNRAFRDLTHRYVFRPLTSRFGLGVGSLIAFLLSGIVHELAITVPAGGGYGGPTLYFLIQGAGAQLERTSWGRRAGLRRGVKGWLLTIAVTALPVTLLFPRPFVIEVIVPFLEALGGVL
jgi:alginate O-acetyltransferase complex protein AlgI